MSKIANHSFNPIDVTRRVLTFIIARSLQMIQGFRKPLQSCDPGTLCSSFVALAEGHKTQDHSRLSSLREERHGEDLRIAFRVQFGIALSSSV